MISPFDIYIYNQGTALQAYRSFGAHLCRGGTEFTLWAPGVQSVAVSGSFNGWGEDALTPIPESGIWTGILPAAPGDTYKYVITTVSGEKLYKADPFAFASEKRPATASKITGNSEFDWQDGEWLEYRNKHSHFKRPMNIYELHAGSWRRTETGPDNPDGFLSWYELADALIPYVSEMGWNYIELLPVAEHPLDASWGYQITGYYAPTARYGDGEGLKYLINKAHRAKIGVILDWVPGHFCRDAQGLGRFNGEMLYEGADHPQWGTYRFDFSRPQVRSFLMSNAVYWLEEFHADGLRVDGVSSMLYLNFGTEAWQEKRRNRNGGEEDLDAIEFLGKLAQVIGERYPGCFTAAEESSAWPMVTKPAYDGGLGFHYKWDMGWMNDTLRYFSYPFEERSRHHNELTFSTMYGFSENFILPLSHDEVVHGKRSLIGRMPGDYSQQFAGLRTLLAYQLLHTGGKLTFMGSELAPFIEWREYEELEWFMLKYPQHSGIQRFVKELNNFYLSTPALWRSSYSPEGFYWLEPDNAEQSVLIFVRRANKRGSEYVCVINLKPVRYDGYRIGLPRAGRWRECFTTDRPEYGGTGAVNKTSVKTDKIPMHGCEYSAAITLPPLGATVLKRTRKE